MKVLKKRANNVAIILVAVLILFDLSPLAVSATNKEAGLYMKNMIFTSIIYGGRKQIAIA